MGSVFARIVKEDCLEEAALSRGLNRVREQLSWLLRRRACQAEGTPNAKSLRQKKKRQLSVSLLAELPLWVSLLLPLSPCPPSVKVRNRWGAAVQGEELHGPTLSPSSGFSLLLLYSPPLLCSPCCPNLSWLVICTPILP